MPESIGVIGIGGSLRAASTSRTALDGASEPGVRSTLICVRDLPLPPYSAEHSIPLEAVQFADTMYACDAMIWSTSDVLRLCQRVVQERARLAHLAGRARPAVPGKLIGLVATAGGIQGLQAVNSMDFIARALRAGGFRSSSRWHRRGSRSARTAS